MAAFDVTTKPTSLNLKPGSTGTIIVVVSNRLGRPVMGVVEGVITPASAARWVVPPPDVQRPYPADPSATVTHEFKITVPENAPAQVAHFRASARDVLAPDDTRSDGQTVAINVTSSGTPASAKKKGLPVWVWLLAGVAVMGTALVIWLGTIGDPDRVPDVIGMSQEEAEDELTEAGFSSVVVKDTLSGGEQIIVMRQQPEAGGNVPKKQGNGAIAATIVVNRPPVDKPPAVVDREATVPDVVGKNPVDARALLRQAGFQQIDTRDTLVVKARGDTNVVISQEPKAGSLLPRDATGSIVVKLGAVKVPPVFMLPQDAATHLLEGLGLKVGKINEERRAHLPDGTVLKSTPAVGQVVRLGTAVDLVVAD